MYDERREQHEPVIATDMSSLLALLIASTGLVETVSCCGAGHLSHVLISHSLLLTC